MNEYYLFENDNQRGPFTLSQLQSMWRSGTITARTLYCQEGFAEWLPLSTILDTLEPPPLPAPDPSAASPRPPHVPVTPPTKLNPGDIICPNPQCGYIGPPKKEARGSGIVAILLCFLFLLPGLIYMAAMSGYNYICPRCGFHIRGGIHA